MFILTSALPVSGPIPLAIAQEEISLGEEGEDLAGSIVSDVLGGSDDESNQDATNTATVDRNQDQTLDQDDISTFGDDTADLDDANVAVPIAAPINIEAEEVQPPECPQGFTLNNNDQCERTVTQDPSCPTVGDFTFNPETNRCESSIDPECTVGTFNPETDQCEQRQTRAPT